MANLIRVFGLVAAIGGDAATVLSMLAKVVIV